MGRDRAPPRRQTAADKKSTGNRLAACGERRPRAAANSTSTCSSPRTSRATTSTCRKRCARRSPRSAGCSTPSATGSPPWCRGARRPRRSSGPRRWSWWRAPSSTITTRSNAGAACSISRIWSSAPARCSIARMRPGCSTSSTAASTTSWSTRRRTPPRPSGRSCAPSAPISLPAQGRSRAVRTFFAVGDEKQSIYSFQGARPDMFAAMKRHFGRSVVRCRTAASRMCTCCCPSARPRRSWTPSTVSSPIRRMRAA